jgi:hypothetical protein
MVIHVVSITVVCLLFAFCCVLFAVCCFLLFVVRCLVSVICFPQYSNQLLGAGLGSQANVAAMQQGQRQLNDKRNSNLLGGAAQLVGSVLGFANGGTVQYYADGGQVMRDVTPVKFKANGKEVQFLAKGGKAKAVAKHAGFGAGIPDMMGMADGGLLDSIADSVKKQFEPEPPPDKTSSNYHARSLNKSKTESFVKGFEGKADGGAIDVGTYKAPASDDKKESGGLGDVAKLAMLALAGGGAIDVGDVSKFEEATKRSLKDGENSGAQMSGFSKGLGSLMGKKTALKAPNRVDASQDVMQEQIAPKMPMMDYSKMMTAADGGIINHYDDGGQIEHISEQPESVQSAQKTGGYAAMLKAKQKSGVLQKISQDKQRDKSGLFDTELSLPKKAKGGEMFVDGGHVPGQAEVEGDSLANDKVPAMLSPGEVVVPRTVIGHGPVAAAYFVSKASKDSNYNADTYKSEKKSFADMLSELNQVNSSLKKAVKKA